MYRPTIRRLLTIVTLALVSTTHGEVPADSPVRDALIRGEDGIQRIIAVPANQRTFANTIVALDDVLARLELDTNVPMFLAYVSTDPAEREAGQRAEEDVTNWLIDVQKRDDLYAAITVFADDAPKLRGEQKRLLVHTLRDFRRAGMALSPGERDELKSIQKEVTRLSIEFEKNIREDETLVPLTRQELTGLPDEYFDNPNLKQVGDIYLVGMSYPQFIPIQD